jgi:ABC-type cobalamin/Fe3+-siderophores transport system ATPase subunit
MPDHPFERHRVSVILQAYVVDLFSRFPGLSQALSKFNLDPDMNVSSLLLQAGHSSGVDEALFESRSERVKTLLLLESILQRPFKTLSRGERQRVKLACDLVSRPNEPRLFLLEEPCTAMDAEFKRRTVELLRSFKEEGYSVVVTLHEASLASRMGDYFYLLGTQGSVAEGDHSVLTTANLTQLFEVDVESADPTEEGYPQFTVSGSSF